MQVELHADVILSIGACAALSGSSLLRGISLTVRATATLVCVSGRAFGRRNHQPFRAVRYDAQSKRAFERRAQRVHVADIAQ
jgi:hypothetical protein